ncbi:MAG: glycosyltransferase [Candidatus Nitrospinota bacterium M3_3B_026]
MKIHQMLPNYWYGDAIGNQVTEIQRLLREWGHESEIFADVIHDRLEARDCRDFERERGDDPWVIYHYSTGSPVNEYALERVEKLILVYHNITPVEFFEGYDETAARNSREGRRLLPKFARKAKLAIAVSPYNEQELSSLGFSNTAVVPLILRFDNLTPSGNDPFGDGKFNILFVGRVAPNKAHADLLKVFHFYRNYINKDSRLVIAGGFDAGGRYYRGLRRLVDLLDLPDVVFTGAVSGRELADYFASASAFLCLSRHEGFCVPLLEAMRFRVPVAALSVSGVRRTMEGAGAVFGPETRPNEIAELLEIIRTDGAVRGRMIESQLDRLDDFSFEKTSAAFRRVLEKTVSLP